MKYSPARDRGISRRSWLLAGLVLPLFKVRATEQLSLRYDGDVIHVTAPSVHFLSDKPLERLKDGAAVAFVAQLDLLNESRVLVRQQKARFVVSLDLWEDKFSVTQLGRTPRSVDRLTAGAAELWCFEGLTMSTLGVPTDRYYWLRFEMRTGSPRDLEGELPQGFNLKELIALLGRKRSEEIHWGPLETRMRLADLPRMQGRGMRG
jgi:hypothetical protein